MARSRIQPPDFFQNPISIDISGASPIALWAAAGGAPPTPPVGGKGLKPTGIARTPYENEQFVIMALRLINTNGTNNVAVTINDGPGGSPIAELHAAPGGADELTGVFKGARGAIPEVVVVGTSPTGTLLLQGDTKTLNDAPRPAAGNTAPAI